MISTSGKAGEQVLVGPPLPAGTWTHVAVTLNGATGTLFLNGKAVATNHRLTLDPWQVLGANTLEGTNAMFLGRGDHGGWFHGLLADFRVYSLPQDPAVIATLADAVTNRAAKGSLPARDTTPPVLPDPGFLQPPSVVGASAVTMSAWPATDDSQQVEYMFARADEPERNSGWIASNRWTDCGVTPGRSYRYAFAVRDAAGNRLPASEVAAVTLPALAPPEAAFASPPRGASPGAIHMAAVKPSAAAGPVEFRFVRADGQATTDWQASPEWTDRSVGAGSSHAYAVEVRPLGGGTPVKSQAMPAVARDETPPARFGLGEWTTLPIAMVDNSLFMRARNVTGGDGEPQIESDPVEYFFHCAAGGGPDSGWITNNDWQSPPLEDGTYHYHFKMRDAAGNETPFSSAQTVAVSPRTGYHLVSGRKISELPDDSLVTFSGTVSEVKPDAYIVTADGARITVTPTTRACATDATFKGRTVTVRGCIRSIGSKKRVTWAQLE